LQRNIFALGFKRVILGEIGFKHEIDLFRNDDLKDLQNILYYPPEYFYELKEDIEKISLSFDIWSLGVVFWEILTQERLFTNQREINDEHRISTIESPGICTELEKLILE
jgi:serine/threonine protein kinase